MEKKTIHILSLGAGVQSSALALMAARGEVEPMPVAAIFADTGDEPQSVYDWLAWLTPQLPFPVVRKQRFAGVSLSDHIRNGIRDGDRVSNPPLFTKPLPGRRYGILTRSCTWDFKVFPIKQAAKVIKKQHKARRVVQWIGISLDEAIRMKPSQIGYIEHRWPLIEMRLTRHDCLRWMEKNGYPKPPRSACVYCPHHSNAEWRRLRDEEPEAFKRAVEFDRAVRVGLHGVQQECFVHRDCLPLDKVDLSTEGERGQGLLWGNECEGMCGV